MSNNSGVHSWFKQFRLDEYTNGVSINWNCVGVCMCLRVLVLVCAQARIRITQLRLPQFMPRG